MRTQMKTQMRTQNRAHLVENLDQPGLETINFELTKEQPWKFGRNKRLVMQRGGYYRALFRDTKQSTGQ